MLVQPQHQKMLLKDVAGVRHHFFIYTSQNQLLPGLQEWEDLLPQVSQQDIMALAPISICQCLPSASLHPPLMGVEEVLDASSALVCGEFRRRSVTRSENRLCETVINIITPNCFAVWMSSVSRCIQNLASFTYLHICSALVLPFSRLLVYGSLL
jgi:hypothetical protein